VAATAIELFEDESSGSGDPGGNGGTGENAV
jgi:hypothetical protein